MRKPPAPYKIPRCVFGHRLDYTGASCTTCIDRSDPVFEAQLKNPPAELTMTTGREGKRITFAIPRAARRGRR